MKESDHIIDILQDRLSCAKEELKTAKKQKMRDILKNPDDRELLDETYAEIEQELTDKIYGLEHQLKTSCDKRSEIIEVNRTAKTVFEAFDHILNKEKLDKTDIGLIVDRITVYENHLIEVKLKADIESILKTGALPGRELGEDFHCDGLDAACSARYTQKTANRKIKTYTVNVVNSGSPS